METGQFRNIIFDLGGVIINLEEERTIKRFAAVSKLAEERLRARILKFDEYLAYEKGLLSDAQFRQIIRDRFLLEASDEEIDSCMNAMLLDIPHERLRLLERLKGSFKLYLLSNTNNIHFTRFNEIVADTVKVPAMDVFFDKAYYSHQIGMRKPDKDIFERVLAENQLVASQTLFIDDNAANIDGAKQAGLAAFHLTHPDQLFDLFS